ncbi:hypothetical protein D1872_286140 [compost metagenome]
MNDIPIHVDRCKVLPGTSLIHGFGGSPVPIATFEGALVTGKRLFSRLQTDVAKAAI